MRTKLNPAPKDRIKVLEHKVKTLKKNYETLYAWLYSHRIRRTDADKRMLLRAKAWANKFIDALEKGKNIKYIQRHGWKKGKLTFVLTKRNIK